MRTSEFFLFFCGRFRLFRIPFEASRAKKKLSRIASKKGTNVLKNNTNCYIGNNVGIVSTSVDIEKTPKNESEISTLATSPKNLQKVPSGTPFWDPKRTRINFEISKSVPKTKKKRFLAPPGTKPKKGQKKTLEP